MEIGEGLGLGVGSGGAAERGFGWILEEGRFGLRKHVTTNAESNCRGRAVPSARVDGRFRVDGRRRERGAGRGGGGVHRSMKEEEGQEANIQYDRNSWKFGQKNNIFETQSRLLYP